MISTSAAFAAAVGGTTRRFRIRLLENGTELGGDIRRAAVHLGSCGASAFQPGTVFSSYAEITAEGSGLTFEGRALELQIGVLLPGGSYEYMTLGRFTAGRPSASVYETTFTAVGSIAAYFTDAFVPPASPTAANVIAALSEQTGTGITLRGLTASGTITKDMTGLTCRQALGVVAGVLGGYATERNDGSVVIAKHTGTATASADGSRMTALPTFADSDTTITGVRVNVPADGENAQAVYESGTPNTERTDAFMTEALFPAYAANLTGLTYRAGTVKLALGDPRLEPWDVLSVTDMAGRTFALPCMNIHHAFDGGLTTEVRAPGLAEDTVILATTGRALLAAQGTAAAATAAAAAAQASVDGLRIGGTNRMLNTATPDISAASKYPRIIGQTTNTYMTAGTKETAEHGFRLTNTGATRPIIRWGGTGASAGLSGLVPGKTYTVSFDYSCRLYSGCADTGSVYLRFYKYDDAAVAGTQAINGYKNVARYTSGIYGSELSGSFSWTFTVPDSVTSISLRLQSNATTAAYFPSGDFIEVRNLKLEEGNRATAWSPAPEDSPTREELKTSGGVVINADNIITGTMDVDRIHLHGLMEVSQSSGGAVGGHLGFMAGSHGFSDGTSEATAGMAMVNETAAATHYLIVTDGGVRMTEHKNGSVYSAYLADGAFRCTPPARFQSPSYVQSTFYDMAQDNITIRPFLLWKNSAPDASFAAQTIDLSGQSLSKFGLFYVSVVWSVSYPGVEDGAWIRVPSGGSATVQASLLWSSSSRIAGVYRQVTFDRGTGEVTFSAGSIAYAGSATTQGGSYAIPQYILGFSLQNDS